jgi:hypothetical protein
VKPEKTLSSGDEIKGAISEWLEEQDKDFYFTGISSLVAQYGSCIKL